MEATSVTATIATNRLREGRLAAERDRVAGLTSSIEANESKLASMEFHMCDAVVEMLRRQAGTGVPTTVKRQHFEWFTRVHQG